MIFKINYNVSLLKAAKQNTYISFCEQRLIGSRLSIHCFLYKLLFDNKIINFHSSKFSYEIKNEISGKIIKCFVANDKTKLFCKLEQLVKHSNNSSIQDKLRGIIFNSIALQREQITREIDDEIFADLNAAIPANDDFLFPAYEEPVYRNEPIQRRFNVEPRIGGNPQPIRRSLDYQGIARRALVVDPMPEGAFPIYNHDVEEPQEQAEINYDIWLDDVMHE